MVDTEARETRAWSLLTARAQSYDWSPGDHGGLSQAEVAGMLAGLEHRAFAAGMLCEAGVWSFLPRVSEDLYAWTNALATAERWNLPAGPGPIQDLVTLAILEATGPSMPCTDCQGTGVTPHLYKEGENRSCELCEGRGRVPRTQRSRAELIGVHETNWRRTWRPRYSRVYGVLNDRIQEARAHLNRALRARRERRA